MTKTSLVVLVLVFVVAISSAFNQSCQRSRLQEPADPTQRHYRKTNGQCDAPFHRIAECKMQLLPCKTGREPEEWDWASDKNKHKLVARDMMRMTNKLNDEYFPYSGKAENMSTILTVTCFTCHNGSKEPETRPKREN